ncbi:MAG: 30S ribosomal protein S9 [Patescibacteria group bacterium]|nr:30S ribosomal protein S9 [Patescibacteria group bacterium]MDE1943869.1 30S ribosomal protein S9 [Patescibacteria group bacterium]MDE1944947.1 30S ribosomal protein S9 [Patescibacteria group bacterium]MDE2057547.1 30S ribosomal protein S9 [Patescibacteria group bacterium]
MATTFTHSVGRRKTAHAAVRMHEADKNSLTVNGKSPKDYFHTETRARAALEAFTVAEAAKNYAVAAHVEGGGLAAQADAVRHAVARALQTAEPDRRAALKSAHLLTRDPRAKERKKPGLKKARKAPQWSKR